MRGDLATRMHRDSEELVDIAGRMAYLHPSGRKTGKGRQDLCSVPWHHIGRSAVPTLIRPYRPSRDVARKLVVRPKLPSLRNN
jgi:hypothetical protein